MNSEQTWPRADSHVFLLTENTMEELVDDICRYGLDREKNNLKAPGLFWELAWGCIYIIRSHLKAGKAITSIMYLCVRKYFVLCRNFTAFCLVP